MLIIAVACAYVVSITIEYLLLRKYLPRIVESGFSGWVFVAVTALGAPLFIFHDLLQHFWDRVAKDER